MGNSEKPVFKSALAFEGRQLAICQAIIAEQKALLAVVRAALPAEIAVSVQHCVRAGNRLIVYTASASWASQIRFFHEAILNKITESGQQNIITVQVRIVPPQAARQPTRAARLPSMEIIEAIRKQSEAQGGDILGLALSRLGLTLEKRLKARKAP